MMPPGKQLVDFPSWVAAALVDSLIVWGPSVQLVIKGGEFGTVAAMS